MRACSFFFYITTISADAKKGEITTVSLLRSFAFSASGKWEPHGIRSIQQTVSLDRETGRCSHSNRIPGQAEKPGGAQSPHSPCLIRVRFARSRGISHEACPLACSSQIAGIAVRRVGRGSVDTGSLDRFPDAIADSLYRAYSEKSRRRQKAAAADFSLMIHREMFPIRSSNQNGCRILSSTGTCICSSIFFFNYMNVQGAIYVYEMIFLSSRDEEY